MARQPWPARYRDVCGNCGRWIEIGELITSDDAEYIHPECPAYDETYDPTLDGKYNALTQKVDRIMTGHQNLRVSGGVGMFASTEKRESRIDITFDHEQIAKWAVDGKDRTALTLALNLHELGHVFHSPAKEEKDSRDHSTQVLIMLNALEDQRQEMLVALQFPKAVDYFRFLNARALAKYPPDGKTFLLHYGRRHLYPDALNARLRELAVERYKEVGVGRIEQLITMYQLLVLPEQMVDAYNIAEELCKYDPVDEQTNADLRHDCMPKTGQPQASKKERSALAKKLRAILGEPPKDATKAKGATTSIAEKPEQAEDGQKSDPDKGEEPQNRPEDSPGAGRADGEAEGEPEPDAGDEPEEAEKLDLDEANAGNEDMEFRNEDGKQAEGTGGKKGGATGTGTLEKSEPDDLTAVIQQMEGKASANVADDVDQKHEALKATQPMHDMGGNRRAGLEPDHTSAARQLSSLFREINQDLRPAMHRDLKRGRLDARRVNHALANNSSRMFKRQQPDLSHDAAMGVHIMTDVSSSMYSIMTTAIGAGFTLARGVELAGHLAKVTTYDTHHKVQKNWLDRQYSMRTAHGGGGTSPLMMLKLARVDFQQLALREKIHNHVAIIVTDGEWSSPKPCQDVIDGMVKDGIHVVLIGIGMVPHGGYKNVTVLSTPDVQGLAATMREPLRKLALDIARNIRRKVAV